eukprot:1137024-Pelagomonas_calceolata.AAC.2
MELPTPQMHIAQVLPSRTRPGSFCLPVRPCACASSCTTPHSAATPATSRITNNAQPLKEFCGQPKPPLTLRHLLPPKWHSNPDQFLECDSQLGHL